jgi:hypothetical protein
MDTDVRPHSLSTGRASRRSVLVAAVWATPVVVGVTALPAAAASTCKAAGVLTSASWTLPTDRRGNPLLSGPDASIGSTGWTGTTSSGLFSGPGATYMVTGLTPNGPRAGFLSERDATAIGTKWVVTYMFTVTNNAKYTASVRVRSNDSNAGIQLLDINLITSGGDTTMARYASGGSNTALSGNPDYERVPNGRDKTLATEITPATTSVTVQYTFTFPKTGVSADAYDGDFWVSQPTLSCA